MTEAPPISAQLNKVWCEETGARRCPKKALPLSPGAPNQYGLFLTYCLRHWVPLDHSIERPSAETTPSMFHGGPMLTEMGLVTVPVPTAFFSFFASRLFPLCVTVNVVPDHWQALASGPQR